MTISALTAETDGTAPARATRLVALEKARLVAAILVVTIHTGFLADTLAGGFLVPSGIARLAVPYFAIMTGYFTVSRAVEQGTPSLKRWALAVFRVYGVLLLLYGGFFVRHMAESAHEHPSPLFLIAQFFRLILLKGYVLHLWYLPCIVYAAYVCAWAVRAARGVAVPLAMAVLLYVGASVMETWWWAVPGGTLARQSDHARLLGEFAFLILLVPFVLMGLAVRRLGDRFPMRAAWWGVALGTAALLAEASLVWRHGGAAPTLVSLLVVVPCGFRVLLGSSAEGPAFPYGPASSLVYYFHLFPLLVWEALVGRRPGDSVPVFAVVALATAAMVAIALRTRLAKLLA